jgi:hypothetical protein
MKKITLILIVCFAFSFNSHSQLFSEDFTGATTNWQSTWIQYDEDSDVDEFNMPMKFA